MRVAGRRTNTRRAPRRPGDPEDPGHLGVTGATATTTDRTGTTTLSDADRTPYRDWNWNWNWAGWEGCWANATDATYVMCTTCAKATAPGAEPRPPRAEYVGLYQSGGHRVVACGRGLQEIASSAGAEVSEAVRAGTARVRTSLLARGENSAATVGAQVNSGAAEAPHADDTLNPAQQSERQASCERANDSATNTNERRVHNEKSHQRSGRSSAGERHAT